MKTQKVVVRTADVTDLNPFPHCTLLSAVVDGVQYLFDVTNYNKTWFTSECGKAIVGSGVVYKYGTT